MWQQLTRFRESYIALKTLTRIPDYYWSRQLVAHQISPKAVSFEQETQRLRLNPLGIALAKQTHNFVLKSEIFNAAKVLKSLNGAEFIIDGQDEIIISVSGFKAIVQNEQDMCILREVVADGAYNFVYDRPTVVWDIGMNTGLASLFFASNPRVQAVYGYEPFRPTYQQALRNFALNPELAPKIKPFAYGVGAAEQVLNLEYSYENKGSIGIYGETTHHYQSQSPKRIEEIVIKPAIAIYDSIRAAHPDASLVAKIDCEGAEYEILTALQASRRLSSITAIMMEWHCQGPKAIETCLREAGFLIFSRLPKGKTVGTIYAARVHSS